ncbi:diguanylate cyclase [Parvibaculum sedimenti]|uniref:Diguanylate cyclase n=1 Tax=Parvibaculum sedimenti TaxID=2608632 RepID=A0A6N6VI27_9HYPH|nr:diguanylate cyclase [Parvibaculum sedimenti]KAB7739406.1 diguanylate cyclase [Parvibaculum sedimenti]
MADTQTGLPDSTLVAQLIEAIPSPIYYVDTEGRFLGCNAAFEASCGLSRGALLGKTAHEIWPKDLADTYQAGDIEVLEKPGPHVQAAEAIFADGSRHQVILHRAAFFQEDGSPGGIVGVGWDVTDRVRAEQELKDHLQFSEQLIETVPSPIFVKDKDGVYLACNRAFEEFCGLKRQDVIGKTVFEVWPMELARTYRSADDALLKKGGVQVYEAFMRAADGSNRNVIFHKATFNKGDGSVGGIIGVYWDVTARKRAEQALRHSEERFRRMVENAPFGVLLTDEHDAITFTNRRFEELLHYPAERMENLETWSALVYPDTKYRAEVMAQHVRDIELLRSGEMDASPVREVQVSCGDSIVRDMEVVITVEENLVYWVFNDVTVRNRAEQALRDVLQAEALHDPLTSLYNRRYLDQALEREFSRAARSGKTVSVVMTDIDHFKNVNDTYGHDCGDKVLQAIARILNTHIRKGDTACRYGGEEFTLLLPDAPLESAVERAERLGELIRDLSVSCDGTTIAAVTMSFGAATYPEHGDTPEKVLKAADEALQRAKSEGRNRVAAAYEFRDTP